MGRTQKVLADTVSRELDLPERTGRLFLRRILDLVADDLVYTGRVELRGLGILVVTNAPARKAVHPSTGKPITIPKKKVLKFRSSLAIRKRLNPSSKPYSLAGKKTGKKTRRP
jgi:nucleoid DNA-binding protein